MYVCVCILERLRMYVCMVEWMRYCGRVWHELCVLYGRWQGRIHYPTVRVGFLTGSVAWRSIPLSKSRVTVLAWPLKAALWRALRPFYNRDTQTDRQTDRGRLATEGHTDRQPMPRDPHTTRAPYARRTRTYECMYRMYVCTNYKYMYVNMNGKLNVS